MNFLYRSLDAPLDSLWVLDPSLWHRLPQVGENVMLRELTRLELLADRLRLSSGADPEIFCDVMAACERTNTLRRAGKTKIVDQFLADRAWTDAALALVALEVPAWSVRRMVYEDGEWLCSLSRQPSLPIEIDDTVDAQHPVLSLAILRALLDARQRLAPAKLEPTARRDSELLAHCCDNFA